MRPTLIPLLPLLLLLAAPALAADIPPATQPAPFSLALVKTADDLAAQPAIHTNLGPAHLGIDTATPLAYGTVTVYVLLDAPPPIKRGPPVDPHPQNVLSASLRPVSRQPEAFYPFASYQPLQQQPAKLLARSLFTGPPGDYLLEFRVGSATVAHADIKVAQKESERWLPLYGRRPGPDNTAPDFRIDLRPAAPIINLALPVLPDGPLPTADAPAKPSADFQIHADGSLLTVDHWPAPAFIPDRQLLAAFYINGKRFIPPIPGAGIGEGGHTGFTPLAGPFTMTFAPDLALLGAKPGDKIELELLCSAAGRADFITGGRLILPVSAPISRSNRITLPNP
ncbi:MAG TPA: hypothetical protein VH253_00210 [Phycisphaerae bacterium]|nr:hypothetical protein [Phycisphaerae bacterium]